jgi:SAM-dependent methyltransferase
LREVNLRQTVSFIYQVMYRVGFTPWDNEQVPGELTDLVVGPDALPAGRALDIGCGTGTQAVYLAQAGWRVTGIDAVEKPLGKARRRAAAAGVAIDWIRGDVTRLPETGLEPGFTLFHDRGCYHGLPDAARTAYARGVSAVAAQGATLLVMAFGRNRKLAGPTGTDQTEIVERFAPEWELVWARPDTGGAPPGPLRDVPRSWYRFVRG